jgi:poly(hydroxyalkanoate) depolymerase family esterase
VSLSKNIEFLRNLPKPSALQEAFSTGWGAGAVEGGLLTEADSFGDNPGQLRMWSYVPEGLSGPMPLVVVLHGCTQNAAGYNLGAGWSTMAERYGFALLMPEQTRSNNPNTCFNWFNAADIARDNGEAASIRQMIARMASDHPIDAKRIFITGLSAGGAMTSVMLATYPDVFAAGAIIAGLPYGIATNVSAALSAMRQPKTLDADTLGDLVRQASGHRGPWPRIAVWHGSADRTVHPDNADEVVKQWLNIHGLPDRPMSTGLIDGYPRQVWWNDDGETIVESYSVTDMAHGTPLGFGADDERVGAQGPYMLEAGISSSYYIAQFFGLTERIHRPRTKPKAAEAPAQPRPKTAVVRHAEPVMFTPRKDDDTQNARRRARAIDINAVITRALTAAGLMK